MRTPLRHTPTTPALPHPLAATSAQARFFTANDQNVPPGTVIDSDVVESDAYDWYMV